MRYNSNGTTDQSDHTIQHQNNTDDTSISKRRKFDDSPSSAAEQSAASITSPIQTNTDDRCDSITTVENCTSNDGKDDQQELFPPGGLQPTSLRPIMVHSPTGQEAAIYDTRNLNITCIEAGSFLPRTSAAPGCGPGLPANDEQIESIIPGCQQHLQMTQPANGNIADIKKLRPR